MRAVGAGGGREQSVCMEVSERRMGGNKAFVWRYQSGGWEGTECLYGAVGEKSIDFFGKLYRLFGKTL